MIRCLEWPGLAESCLGRFGVCREREAPPSNPHRDISFTLNQSFAELGRNKRSLHRAANTSQIYPRRKFPYEYQMALASDNINPKQATYGPGFPFGQNCLKELVS